MSNARKPPRPPFKDASGRKARLAPLLAEPAKGRSNDARDEEGAGAAPAADGAPPGLERIAKLMARAGACSRRDAEVLIAEGRVTLNGVVLASPAINVGPRDAVAIDGVPLAARARTRLFLLHKPRGLVTTERDPEGRRTVFDHVRERNPQAPRLISVGRLDINTEGLLLLTNDGGLARALELPSTGWARRYRVRAKGEIDQRALDALRGGISVEGVDYAQIEATLDRVQGANCWLTMSLREGKNREIKRVLEHLGLEVNRLIRLSYGPFQLAGLDEGAMEEVRTRVLRDQLGPTLAQEAGVDFTGPLGDAPAPESEPRSRAQKAEPPAQPQKSAPRARLHEERREGKPAARGAAEQRAGRPRSDARARPEPELEAAPALTRRDVAGRARKHVSTLRGEREGASAGRREDEPRRRIERSATADRKGRAIAVERVSLAKKPAQPEAPARAGRPARPPRAEGGARGAGRREERGAERQPGRGGRFGDERRGPAPRERFAADEARPARGRGARPPEGGKPEARSREARGDERRGEGGFKSGPRGGAGRGDRREGFSGDAGGGKAASRSGGNFKSGAKSSGARTFGAKASGPGATGAGEGRKAFAAKPFAGRGAKPSFAKGSGSRSGPGKGGFGKGAPGGRGKPPRGPRKPG